MINAKVVTTPTYSAQTLSHKGSISLNDPLTIRAVVVSLQYLCLTCPSMAFVVNRLSHFMHCPATLHLESAKRVLRYLAGTANKGLYFSHKTPFTLHAYSDADWA